MSSDYYQGMVYVLGNFLRVAMAGLYTASSQGAGFQSLDMLSNAPTD
ncbi:hypothetical protein [Rhodococcus sp. NPDC060176]